MLLWSTWRRCAPTAVGVECRSHLLLGVGIPAGVWAGQLVGGAATGLLAWPVQMWLGTLVLASLGGLAIGLVSKDRVASSNLDRTFAGP